MIRQTSIGSRLLVGAAALAGLALAAPLDALAVTPSVGAKIINQATVSYDDLGGNNYKANAAATVTVTLKATELLVTGPNGTGAANCPPGPTNSGGTTTVMNAVVAQANGSDDYTLSVTVDATTDVAGATVEFTLYNSAGGVITGPTSGPYVLNDFGSAIAIGSEDADTLLFDGGVVLSAMFAAGDIVVVNGVAYKVAAGGVVDGTAASHAHDGGINYTTEGALTADLPGKLTLEAFQVQIPAGTGPLYGTNTAPAFGGGGAEAGFVVGEMVLVETSVTANSTSQTTPGTVDITFTTDGTDEGPDTNTTTNSCPDVTFNPAASVQIQKQVRNVTAGGAFGPTASGKPGETLEYQVTVTNPSASDAINVVVTDAVPEYTQLVVSGGNFATASLNGGAAVDITEVATDDESPTVASGNAAGTAANSAMTFYIGAGNSDVGPPADTGGTLSQDDDVVIKYQVTID